MAIFSKSEESVDFFFTLQYADQERIARNQLLFLKEVLPFSAMKNILDLVATATSLYRSPEYNLSVGGAPRSKHLWGLAGDWPEEIFQKLTGGSRSIMNKKTVEPGIIAWYHFMDGGKEFIHVELRPKEQEAK